MIMNLKFRISHDFIDEINVEQFSRSLVSAFCCFQTFLIEHSDLYPDVCHSKLFSTTAATVSTVAILFHVSNDHFLELFRVFTWKSFAVFTRHFYWILLLDAFTRHLFSSFHCSRSSY